MSDMKKTVNANIGSLAFIIDEDAYKALGDYLDDVGSRLSDLERGEVMEDLEARFAEIFRERLTVPGQVVSLSLVRQAISMLGAADCFGDRPAREGRHCAPAEDVCEPRRLFRSRRNRSVAGICAGLAEYMGWDASAVRLGTVLLVLFGGLSLWVYIILWIVVPLEPCNHCKP